MKHACLLASDLLILVGCSTSQPLYSVDNTVVFTRSDSKPTLEQIRRAIVASVTRKGWTAKNIGSRQIQATLNVRKNIARVVIAYSTRSNSIAYKDSHTVGLRRYHDPSQLQQMGPQFGNSDQPVAWLVVERLGIVRGGA